MTHLFIDTDVILDFLGNRKPFSKYAAQLFLGAHNGDLKLYTSGNSITTAYYILSKDVSEKQTRSLINDLLDYIHIIPVNDKTIKLALKSDFNDFEDGVQHFCALNIDKIRYFVTRNLKDYRKSQIKAISPELLFVE